MSIISCFNCKNKVCWANSIQHWFRLPNNYNLFNTDYVVCLDGTCVENEIMCKPLKECPDKYPYLCFGSSCQIDFSMCPSNIACGDYKSLCEDHICRESCDKE